MMTDSSINNRISIDDIDLKILINLYNLRGNQQMSTLQIATKIFKDEIKNNYDKVKKNNLVTKKLLRLSHYGLIEVNNNGISKTKYFDLISDNVVLKSVGLAGIKQRAIFLKISDSWNAFIRDFLN